MDVRPKQLGQVPVTFFDPSQVGQVIVPEPWQGAQVVGIHKVQIELALPEPLHLPQALVPDSPHFEQGWVTTPVSQQVVQS